MLEIVVKLLWRPVSQNLGPQMLCLVCASRRCEVSAVMYFIFFFEISSGQLRVQRFLTFFYISYPFIEEDYQIYPQCTQWWSFIENTKLTNSYNLE